MPDVSNPFTEEEFDQLEKAIARGGDIEEAIKKAKRAGIDLPDLLEQNRANVERLRKILTTYRPGR